MRGELCGKYKFYFRWSRFVNISSDHHLHQSIFSRFVVLMVSLLASFVLLFWQTKSVFINHLEVCSLFSIVMLNPFCDCSRNFIYGGLWFIDRLPLYIKEWALLVLMFRGYENSSEKLDSWWFAQCKTKSRLSNLNVIGFEYPHLQEVYCSGTNVVMIIQEKGLKYQKYLTDWFSTFYKLTPCGSLKKVLDLPS